ncbi:MAG: cytochrome c biogenesis CcdA family protein [Bauldia sp.]
MLEISGIGIIAALGAGAISFLSPCVLPLVPGYVSYIAGSADAVLGESEDRRASRARTFGLSVSFVLGFSTIFIALGAGATVLGGFLLRFKAEAAIVGGLLIILFGLFTTGLVRLPFLQRDLRFHRSIRGGGPGGAYLLGLAFGFGWTPCIGPVLGSILSVSAVATTMGSGIALLAVYSLGLGVPFLVAAIFARGLAGRLRSIGRLGRILNIVAGGVMIVMGVALATGTLSRLSFWLLEVFPVFGRIG